jgi:hypothetical protein
MECTSAGRGDAPGVGAGRHDQLAQHHWGRLWPPLHRPPLPALQGQGPPQLRVHRPS